MTTAARKKRKLSLHPISLMEFNQQFLFRFREGEIEEEFELLQEHSANLYQVKPRDIGQDEINKPKNRFIDIVPCESDNQHEQQQHQHALSDEPVFLKQPHSTGHLCD